MFVIQEGVGVAVSCDDGTVRVFLAVARICVCGHPTYFGINRDGRTRCLECDSRYQDEHPARVKALGNAAA